jgi:hypothetical protein
MHANTHLGNPIENIVPLQHQLHALSTSPLQKALHTMPHAITLSNATGSAIVDEYLSISASSASRPGSNSDVTYNIASPDYHMRNIKPNPFALAADQICQKRKYGRLELLGGDI